MFEYVDRTDYTYKIADDGLYEQGGALMDAAKEDLADFEALRREYEGRSPLKGLRVACSVRVAPRSVAFAQTLVALGADVRICPEDANSDVMDPLAALIAHQKISIFAWDTTSYAEFWWCARKALAFADGKGPDAVIDEAGRLTLLIGEGVKFAHDSELYQKDYSEAGDETFELVELLRTVRGRVDWVSVSDRVGMSLASPDVESIRSLIGFNAEK